MSVGLSQATSVGKKLVIYRGELYPLLGKRSQFTVLLFSDAQIGASRHIRLPKTMANYTHDVFLSHSHIDKPLVRELAKKLRDNGIRVWFDEWEVKTGQVVLERVQEGLENSRVLVACVSINSWNSEWAKFEYLMVLAADPLNHAGRVAHLRLDGSPLKPSMAAYSYIDWHSGDHEVEYQKLLAIINAPAPLTSASNDAQSHQPATAHVTPNATPSIAATGTARVPSSEVNGKREQRKFGALLFNRVLDIFVLASMILVLWQGMSDNWDPFLLLTIPISLKGMSIVWGLPPEMTVLAFAALFALVAGLTILAVDLTKKQLNPGWRYAGLALLAYGAGMATVLMITHSRRRGKRNDR